MKTVLKIYKMTLKAFTAYLKVNFFIKGIFP